MEHLSDSAFIAMLESRNVSREAIQRLSDSTFIDSLAFRNLIEEDLQRLEQIITVSDGGNLSKNDCLIERDIQHLRAGTMLHLATDHAKDISYEETVDYLERLGRVEEILQERSVKGRRQRLHQSPETSEPFVHVRVILRKNLEQFEIQVGGGASAEGDAEEQNGQEPVDQHTPWAED